MDWLIDVEAELAHTVYPAVTGLLDLEVDLLFYDTTSTYFETDEADLLFWRDTRRRSMSPTTPSRPPATRTLTNRSATTTIPTRPHHWTGRSAGPGSGPTASRRTTATTCRRW